jgi:hypothetical protein
MIGTESDTTEVANLSMKRFSGVLKRSTASRGWDKSRLLEIHLHLYMIVPYLIRDVITSKDSIKPYRMPKSGWRLQCGDT